MKEALRQAQPQTLSQMENRGLKNGQAVTQRMRQECVVAAPEPAAGEGCEGCGGKLRDMGKGKKWVVTRAGEGQVARDYDSAQVCRAGFLPRIRVWTSSQADTVVAWPNPGSA